MFTVDVKQQYNNNNNNLSLHIRFLGGGGIKLVAAYRNNPERNLSFSKKEPFSLMAFQAYFQDMSLCLCTPIVKRNSAYIRFVRKKDACVIYAGLEN